MKPGIINFYFLFFSDKLFLSCTVKNSLQFNGYSLRNMTEKYTLIEMSVKVR